MICGVVITEDAEDDLEGIYQHIAISIGEPQIAWNQIERIRDKILKLNHMPERNPVIQYEPWKSREARRVDINNFAAFYVLNTNVVTVIRVLYAKRDLSNISL